MTRCSWIRPVALVLLFAAAWPCLGQEMTRVEADRLYEARKYAEAIAAYEQLLPQAGDRAGAIHLQIAMARRYQGKTGDAIADFDAALATGQLTAEQAGKARLERGYCLYMSRRYDEALEALKQVMADAGASPTCRQEAGMYAGYLLNKTGRSAEAIAMFQQAASEQNTLPAARAAALLSVADTYRTLKDFDQARAGYQHIASLGGDVGAIGVKAQTRLQELDAVLAGDTPFYIAPYLTKLSAERAELFWVSKGALSDASVRVEAQGHPTLPFTVTAKDLAEGGFMRQHAVLSPLAPWTRYRYTATGGEQSRQGTFMTPPPPGVDPGPIRFSVLGDTQTNAIAHTAVAPGLAKHQPAFVVHCGDFVELGSRWLEWKSQFFDPGLPYLSQSAFWPTRGNHDSGAYFPPLFGLEEKQYYSFDYGPVHFVVLDSFGPHASAKGRAQQAQWLREDLAANKARWIFAAVHDPMVNQDYTLPWWGYHEITPAVHELGVDVVFSGHHHLYRRFLPMQLGDHKPVLHVTTGGSGGALGGALISPIAVTLVEKHHHVNVTVEGDTLTMQSVDTQGNVLDEVVLHKRGNRYQDEVMAQAVPLELAHQVASLLHHFVQNHTDNVVLARFEAPIQPGAAVAFSFDTNRLASGKLNIGNYPPDTRIVIDQAPSSPWTVAKQEALLNDGTLRFTATAPASLALTAGGDPMPALEMTMTVRVGDRLFVPQPVIVRAATEP